MSNKWIAAAAVTLVAIVSLAAVGPTPRYIEELVIGGGIADSIDGGTDIDKSGNIQTTGKLTTGASSTARASISLPHGTAPTTPVNGDLWTTTTGVHAQINGATTGPLLTNSTIPWNTPGAIGSTTPNSGTFTNGTFTGSIFMSGSNANFDANGTAAQLQFFHTRSSGNASVRFQPVPQDGVGQASVDFFRSTSTSGYVGFLLRRGDGTATSVFEVKAGTNPTTYLRNSSGASKFEVDHNSGNAVSSGDAIIKGGDVTAGEDSITRGILTLTRGDGGNTPGSIKLASPNGTIWYLFVEDDGTLKVNSTLPTANGDGAVIGSQF
ncbi:MAG: hypothetical protein SGI88_21405 [Candidatus Hydrogenedentes bacterium]|nr:hypothetical protein [Candidatus Hydrogenedentota bacterium]